MALTLRPLRPEDIPFGMTLKDQAGWNQTEEDWRSLLSFRPDGCFLALHEGAPAGTVTTIDHAGAFGWVGMLLVRHDLRRLGIGRALLRRSVASLAHLPAVKLDATPLGEGLYRSEGFEAEAVIERRVRAGSPSPRSGEHGRGLPRPRPMVPADLQRAADLDTPGFGARREAILDAWCRSLPGSSLVIEETGGIRGFVIARRGSRAIHIGPLVADGADAAMALLGAVLDRMVSEDLILGTMIRDPAWMQFLDAEGFRGERILTRMRLGLPSTAPRPSLLWASAGPEVG